MSNPYPYYIDIVTKRYFDGVDNKRLEQVLDCFHPDAVLHEMTSDTKHDGIDAILTPAKVIPSVPNSLSRSSRTSLAKN